MTDKQIMEEVNKAMELGKKQGRVEVVNELLAIENHCDNCYMQFCESCKHNGEYAFKIMEKLEQLKEQKE